MGKYHPQRFQKKETIGMSEDRNHELAHFLRSRREKVASRPLVGARKRRTPGMRREEVAEAAGISVDWYVRLEQGRGVVPSAATVAALARALTLSPAEHDHLLELSRPVERGHFARECVPLAMRQLVESLTLPAYVSGRRWDVLAWNAEADRLFGLSHRSGNECNILVRMFTDRAIREMFGSDWSAEAQRMLAQFRTMSVPWAAEPEFIALRERLERESPEFSAWWERHEVRRPSGGEKKLHIQQDKEVRFQHSSFQSTDDPTLRLVIYQRL
jgi:transcriptional regulator with XRE-family HTH domain